MTLRRRNTNKIKKLRDILTLDNLSTSNLSRKKNLFKENKIRTKSNDNKISKILKTQNKSLIRSRIFDNMNIKKYKTSKINKKLGKNFYTLNNTEAKLNSMIKVNVKMRKEKYDSSTNNTNKKNIMVFDYSKKIKSTETNLKNISKAIFKSLNEKRIYNILSHEKVYNDEINKIVLIQKFWKKYLFFKRNPYNKKSYINDINNSEARIIFTKIKKIIYSHILKLLKYLIYNIKLYIHYWHDKIYLKIILKKIILNKMFNNNKNISKKIPNYILFKNQNFSCRQMRSNFNRFKDLNTYNNIFLNISNNVTSTNNYVKNNSLHNFIRKTHVSSLSYFNTSRNSPLNNKSTKNNKNPRNILIKGINSKIKSNLSELFRHNEMNLNSLYQIKKTSNKDSKNKNCFAKKIKKIEFISNNKTIYLNFDKGKNDYKLKRYKNRILKTSLGKNKDILFNYKNDVDRNITHNTENNMNYTTNEPDKRKDKKLKNNINNVIKNKLYKLKKFDTCPLSFMNKKRNNNSIHKPKIKKYLLHWKYITFKTKFVNNSIKISNKRKLRNIFYRKVIRIIMDYFQILLLKKYFDEYQNKAIKTNVLLKLKAYLLKNDKLKKYVDDSNKENFNYYSLKRGDIINNININNFITYNDSNKIISSPKNYNIWNNFKQGDDFGLSLPYIKNNENNFINAKKNYKMVKIKNSFPKGILVDQINQLRMAFNLLQQNKLQKTGLKKYFHLWKKNILNKANFKKINVLEKKIKLENNRNIIINKKLFSPRENNQNNNQKFSKSKFMNNKNNRFINDINKKIIDNSSESSTIRSQINSEIIYTKKILNPNQIFSNNYYRNNYNILTKGLTLRRINNIEEREVHFNSLNMDKDNSSIKNIFIENSFNNKDKLTESLIKTKIAKIKIDLMDNSVQKPMEENNAINYNYIFKNIKKYFTEINRKIDFKNFNQTFYYSKASYKYEI